MNSMCLLIIAVAICGPYAAEALTREEIFRIVSAGIPGARSRYQPTPYRYVPTYPSNNYKYIPQFPPYVPPGQQNVPPPRGLGSQQQGGVGQPNTIPSLPARSQSCNEDPSAIYQLSSDMTNYPTVAITTELVKRPDIMQTLSRTVIPDPTLLSNGNGLDMSSCKTTLMTLASFISPDNGKRCWFLQTYQETVEFTNCGHGSCDSCSSVPLPGLKPSCTANFRYVSVWAYCENVTQGSPILFKRLVIPAFCSCKLVQPCQ